MIFFGDTCMGVSFGAVNGCAKIVLAKISIIV